MQKSLSNRHTQPLVNKSILYRIVFSLNLVLNFRPPTIEISGIARFLTTTASVHTTRALFKDNQGYRWLHVQIVNRSSMYLFDTITELCSGHLVSLLSERKPGSQLPVSCKSRSMKIFFIKIVLYHTIP